MRYNYHKVGDQHALFGAAYLHWKQKIIRKQMRMESDKWSVLDELNI